jgi:hypothetical protein
MKMNTITNNPTKQLAMLIRPEEDRLLAMRATEYDAFRLVDGIRLMDPRPPLRAHNSIRHSLFETLASGVKNPGDSIRIVRLSKARIGVYYEHSTRCEEDLLEEYGNYIAGIECPSKYARAWRDFVALMLQSVETISVGLETVLGHSYTDDLDTRVEDADELAIISSLSPYSSSLRKMFDITSVFYANLLVTERWEKAFIRGQKHHMGNALFPIVLLNQFLDSGMLTYQDLHDMIQGTNDVFNPVVHIREALSREDIGRWLNIEIVEGAGAEIRPVRRLALRRTLDEIFYRAGTESEGKSQRLDVRWHAGEGVLSLWTDGDAFRSFRKDSPARKRLSEIYGNGGIQFIKERTDRAEDRISLIRVSVEQRDGSDSGSGGGSVGTGSNSENSIEASTAALAMQSGAEVYTTSLAATAAAMATVSV